DTVEKCSTACQTDFKCPSTNTPAKTLPIKKSKSSSDSLHMNGKDDSHLMATIRGMRVDLAIKEKAVLRLTRELDECKKTIKKLQKEKETNKSAASTSKKSDGSIGTEPSGEVTALKDSQNKIKMLEYDYGVLHNKRLNDLKTLQTAHERELATCKETIQLLQQRLAERDEAFAVQKRRKVPIDYFALKAKRKMIFKIYFFFAVACIHLSSVWSRQNHQRKFHHIDGDNDNDLSLWIDEQQVKMFSGFSIKIYAIDNGKVSAHIKDPNFNHYLPVIPSEVSSVNFTWKSGSKKYYYNFDRLQSLDESILKPPTLSIKIKGRIPQEPKEFSVSLPCSGNSSGIAMFSIGFLIQTSRGKPVPGTPLRLSLKKECALRGVYDRTSLTHSQGPDPECDKKCANKGWCKVDKMCQCKEGYMGQNLCRKMFEWREMHPKGQVPMPEGILWITMRILKMCDSVYEWWKVHWQQHLSVSDGTRGQTGQTQKEQVKVLALNLELNIFHLCLLILCVFYSPSSAYRTPEPIKSRILGGVAITTATAPDAASVVSIRFVAAQANYHIGGGFIINTRWIGTAAQCIIDLEANSTVVAVGRPPIGGGTIYLVDKLVPHPNYTALTLDNDVGVLRTTQEITFSNTIQRINLGAPLEASYTARVFGWGRVADTGAFSEVLRSAAFTTVSHEICISRFPFVARRFISPNHQICFQQANIATCAGDVGGPIIHNGTVVAIVSWVEPCIASQTSIADTTTSTVKMRKTAPLMDSSNYDGEDSDTLNNEKSTLDTSIYYDAESSRKSSFNANRKSSVDYSFNSTLNRRRSPDINVSRNRESPILRQSSPSLRENRHSPCMTPPHTNRYDKHYVNKCTSPSPTRSMISMSTSTSFCRERNLESEIEVLQEKLKDTEERLQSLRLQYDSLSQTHRALRDNQNQTSEEAERLKIDVQHLNDCANKLRAELQTARNDRSEALELQKVLQKELDESRADKKKIVEQNDKDAKTIQDLHRQCKEMERILIRKHPDSVSALIVASKNPNCTDDKSASRRLLEQRIAQLEADAKEQDVKAQKILANVQSRFNSVQSKYEQHIGDLETQVLSLQEINAQLNETIMEQTETIKSNQKVVTINQTFDVPERDTVEKCSTACQTDFKCPSTNTPAKTLPIKKSKSSSDSLHMNGKDDSHLMATIRGMRVDLAIKEKAVLRLTRELDECKKTIKKLQKEKETNKSAASTSKKSDGSIGTEPSGEVTALKDSQNKIKMLEYDYGVLHNKRLNDLKTLQTAHERELATCKETIQLLQQRLAERDEAFAVQKRRNISGTSAYRT
ncbi:Protein shifted, partial [Pseudolycoriella hygida]